MHKRDIEKILKELDRRAERAAKAAGESWQQGENGAHFESMAIAYDEAIILIEAMQKKEKMNKSILRRAIDTYGVRAQMRQTIEEMAELTQAICKIWRVDRSEPLKEPRKVLENLVEETADCLIMLEQMKLILDSDDVNEVIEAKIKRLEERLNAREENEKC